MKTLEINVEDEALAQVYALLSSIEGVKAIRQQNWEEIDGNDTNYLKGISKSLAEDWDSDDDKVWDEIYKKANV